VLATAQQKAVLAAMDLRAAFGVQAPEADVTDLFLPDEGTLQGELEVQWYRGKDQNEYLYRCWSTAKETLAIATTHDEDAWSRCEGRVWIDLNSGRARTNATDQLSAVGGSFFELSIGRCSEEFATIRSEVGDAARVQSDMNSAHELDPSRQSPMVLTFLEGASAEHVACKLVWLFGPFSVLGREGRSSTVRLPSGLMAPIELLDHILVRPGESLRIEADPTSPTMLELGRWQLQVAAGARLELHGVGIVDAVGASAMVTYGEVTATNCTFARCVGGVDLILRFAEGSTPEGSDEHPPVHGVFAMSIGAAVLTIFSKARFRASGCVFLENIASGARVVNAGGAIGSMGGQCALSAGTILRGNVAESGVLAARGAAIYSGSYSRWDIRDAQFIGNWARGASIGADATLCTASVSKGTLCALYTRGGAIDFTTNSDATISSTLFKENRARGASIRAQGGALAMMEGSTIRLTSCSFLRNEAVLGAQLTRGGAIDAYAGVALRVSFTTFDGNTATGSSESSGGAIHSESLLILEGGLVFRANAAAGDIKAKGGAIALLDASASLNATCLPGPVFVGNTVRHALLVALHFCERFGVC
jgi:predicted outer membrane repeat protein